MRERVLALYSAAALLAAAPAAGQLAGNLVRGQYGLAAASAPAEGLLLSLGVQDYLATSIVGPDGKTLPTSGTYNSLTAPSVSMWWVSPWKILGGTYGAQLAMWGTTSRTDSPRFGVTQSPPGYGDMWFQPLGLSWEAGRVNAIAGFAIYIPSGTYLPDGENNTGQGQWGYEFSGGATVYLDKGQHWNFTTLAFFDIYSAKRGAKEAGPTHLRTGDTFSLQGGLGYQFHDAAWNVGVPYFLDWKVTPDTFPPGFEAVFPRISTTKNWSAGVGAEVDYAWNDTDSVQLRWVQGFGGRNTTNGASFFLYYNHQITFGSKAKKSS